MSPLLVLLVVWHDDFFAQVSNIICVVHCIFVKYFTRIWFLFHSSTSDLHRLFFYLVLAFVPVLFLVYSGLFADVRRSADRTRKWTVMVCATAICAVMSSVLLGVVVGTTLGLKALFSYEFFFVQIPFVYAVILLMRKSRKPKEDEEKALTSLPPSLSVPGCDDGDAGLAKARRKNTISTLYSDYEDPFARYDPGFASPLDKPPIEDEEWDDSTETAFASQSIIELGFLRSESPLPIVEACSSVRTCPSVRMEWRYAGSRRAICRIEIVPPLIY
ncbi:hypothetical protein FRB94_009534 [Tulasnella sp. JGI-2019a]|nr:hypothetical protein FRB94_009534 [Tulasnella sp. JGI-2019a]